MQPKTLCDMRCHSEYDKLIEHYKSIGVYCNPFWFDAVHKGDQFSKRPAKFIVESLLNICSQQGHYCEPTLKCYLELAEEMGQDLKFIKDSIAQAELVGWISVHTVKDQDNNDKVIISLSREVLHLAWGKPDVEINDSE
jgi:hypothetical protein